MIASTISIQQTSAATSLKLPNRSVTLETFNDTDAFFVSKLTNVPSGYDVSNTSYLGWCVDRTAEMTRSPSTHLVTLYSSLNPPAFMANESWDMVNYILNHKQGNKFDIQDAIWYFVNMNSSYTNVRTTAWTLINDTLTNGKGFIPSSNQVTAVICHPVRAFSTDTSVQISIIEVTGNTSDEPSNTSGGNTSTIRLPQINLYIVALVVVAIIAASVAVLARQRAKKAR